MKILRFNTANGDAFYIRASLNCETHNFETCALFFLFRMFLTKVQLCRRLFTVLAVYRPFYCNSGWNRLLTCCLIVCLLVLVTRH